uniref:H-2 class I histocompatibility antigen, D-D alpha chain-like n=1 Tax=Gasterosteus aculeatus aculeatus TaxID=481459 RepID=UPI001A97FE91|nr:H-2 class I histocompatibility antigen, D-D alpha chain-like [Gasterosteus aculeatus aculeatus]XP_040045373.1 H-2 class I histocompatibility antigen, D-D alpha chain-like [Gasterosteus aculeatus aculeatus]
MRLVGAEISVLSLLMMSLHGAAALTHSLKYFYTGSSGLPNFPEFVIVGLVDEVEVVHYDSDTWRLEPRQDWVSRVTEDDHWFWNWQTGLAMNAQREFKGYIKTAKQRFNQTGGVHIVQNMYGCEWDDETNEVKGYDQYGYNGEDFISFDLQTERYIAAKQQASIIKQKWNQNRALIAGKKNFLTHECPEGLKKFLSYGRSSLMRTERPSVSLLQKTPSSPVSCHATGFYPHRAALFWRKDGEELHEDVDLGEILPNHDGTFQMRVDLKLSSVPAEDWRRYDCVFQLSGVDEDIVTKLDKTRTNRVTHSLKYFLTASSGVPNFPEFVIVGLLDEVEVGYYDSDTWSAEPRQDWVSRVREDQPWVWLMQTRIALECQQEFKAYIEIAKRRFNQTGGVHVMQRMVTCEWDDETNEVKGYDQYGYDGEDFLSYDLQTEQWIAQKQQAVIIKEKLDRNRDLTAGNNGYLTDFCGRYLNIYLNYGRSSLMRTERPSVSLLQKTPSSPVSCHATGFYPDRADLFWRKDGEQLHEDVDLGEILPNHDGTFQMRVDLKLSSVPAEDWRRYDCVFQLSGVDEDIVTKLDKTRTNTEKPAGSTFIIIIIIIAVAVLVVIIAAVVGFKVHRKRNAQRSSSSSASTDGSEVTEELNPIP